MKKLLLIVSLAVAGLAGFAPTTASAQRFTVEIGDRPYYRGAWYWGPHRQRMYWVPGHWEWRRHHRVWIHGHYVVRERRFWR